MAHHPFQPRPFVVRLVNPEQVHIPVQVALQSLRVHAAEAPQVAFELKAELVHESHALEVLRVTDVCPVGLVHTFDRPDRGPVRLSPCPRPRLTPWRCESAGYP